MKLGVSVGKCNVFRPEYVMLCCVSSALSLSYYKQNYDMLTNAVSGSVHVFASLILSCKHVKLLCDLGFSMLFPQL
jgi:hypothetical protein